MLLQLQSQFENNLQKINQNVCALKRHKKATPTG